jgi:23S rRNA (uracil1939-C5)-methyltransferase
MDCIYQNICGGCPLRAMSEAEYRRHKFERFKNIVARIHQQNIALGEPIFIADGERRRAELTFQYKKGQIILGFNEAQSHTIIDIQSCPALSAKLNLILPHIREFLSNLCQIKVTQKIKNKFITSNITQGEIWLTEAANGIDVLLEIDEKIALEHRMEICDFTNRIPEIIRVCVGKKNSLAETVAEKVKPHVNIAGREVFIPAGTFLQASAAGEKALTSLVVKYMGDTTGNIADLFCGVGTFSYPLSCNIKNKITAIDSSAELLDSFQKTVNFLMIPNIKIIKKNLFKYPLDADELKNFTAVVFDPPRAGAAAQVAQIARMNQADKPQKIIAVSCNPHTFINDANQLADNGYKITEITMADQFVYAEHFELVACFEKIL